MGFGWRCGPRVVGGVGDEYGYRRGQRAVGGAGFGWQRGTSAADTKAVGTFDSGVWSNSNSEGDGDPKLLVSILESLAQEEATPIGWVT